MDTSSFLSKVLPETGLYFVEIPRGEAKGFAHHLCHSIAEMVQKAGAFDAAGHTVYYATAAYREPFVVVDDVRKPGRKAKRSRVQANVRAIRAFWLDLDVGKTEPDRPAKYPDQAAALQSFVAFLKETRLPAPMFVSSGYGVHIYWPLTEEITPEKWKLTAERLKRLCAERHLLTDPMRTGDSASVLRPVGMTNRKGGGERPVQVIRDAEPVSHTTLDVAIVGAMARLGIPEVLTTNDRIRRLNEQFHVKRELPPSDHVKVAEHCAQIRKMRDTGGCIPEPTWYAALQVLQHTIGGRGICHEWSKGYSGYSEAETERKLDQAASFGPASCSTFEGRNPEGCRGCPFKGQITSPIQLGSIVTAAVPPVVAEVPAAQPGSGSTEPALPADHGQHDAGELPPIDCPEPFMRGDAAAPGLYLRLDGDVPIKFYDHDLYPTKVIYDEFVGAEQIAVRHWLPKDGWCTFRFEAATIADPKAFNKAMRENSVQPYMDARVGDFMRHYMDSYIRRLKERNRIQRLFTSFGWRDKTTSFVLGKKIYTPGGEDTASGSSAKIGENLAGQIVPCGEFAKWFELTKLLNKPEFAPHAFAFCTAFGAPLMELIDYNGVTIVMHGKTNGGKSTMARLASSVYGKSTFNWMGPKPTEFALYNKLGSLNSLPLYIDESTNIAPEMLSMVVYQVANGTSRERLKSDATPREVDTWKSMLLVSTNHSVYDQLEQWRRDSEPEKVRVLQYDFPVLKAFAPVAETIRQTVTEHYGHAGEPFIKFLVANRDQVRAETRKMIEVLAKRSKIEGMERFMVAGAACTLVGAYHAYRLGLIGFNPMNLLDWVASAIQTCRHRIADAQRGALGTLAEFLDDTMSCRLAVSTIGKDVRAIKLPIGSLTQRVDVDKKKLWISRQAFRAYCVKQRADFDEVVAELVRLGYASGADVRRTLGAGVPGYEGAQVRVLEIDLSTEELARFAAVEAEPAKA